MPKKEDLRFQEFSEYLNKLASRISLLETQSGELVKSVKTSDSFLNNISQSFSVEIEGAKKTLNDVDIGVKRAMREITLLVKEFKNLAKSERFERLQRRTDDWNPERFVTRREVKRLVEEE